MSLGVIGRGGTRAADAVDVHREPVDAELLKQIQRKGDALRIHACPRRTIHLPRQTGGARAAAGLRFFIAEYRAIKIIHLCGLRFIEKLDSMNMRATPAVPSGFKVTERSPLSVKVYISFWTTSVVSPTLRRKSSVCSNTGVRVSLKHKRCTNCGSNPPTYLPFVAFLGGHIPHPLGYLVLHCCSPHTHIKIRVSCPPKGREPAVPPCLRAACAPLNPVTAGKRPCISACGSRVSFTRCAAGWLSAAACPLFSLACALLFRS